MRKKNGFSLLELLVVISIIAILIAIGMVGFTAVQKRGRDARRRGDMKAWQDALEQLYAEETDYNGSETNCSESVSQHMNGVTPVDPKGGSYTYTASCNDDNYCICAELEQADGNNSADDCSGWVSSSGAYYCVGNLQ